MRVDDPARRRDGRRRLALGRHVRRHHPGRGFVDGLVWASSAANVGAALFPALTFIFAALLATGIGTAVAFTSLVFPAGILLGADPVLLFGAILSGAVFGDNLAPVSDTTIVSAVTQDAASAALPSFARQPVGRSPTTSSPRGSSTPSSPPSSRATRR